MSRKHQDIKLYLQRISNVLLINGGFSGNPGLFTGEMGIALFFAHYARFTQNALYSDYCFDLLEKIHNRIHRETTINYMHGLTGIGSAIEYLVQNNFYEANTDEILLDFDKRVLFTFNLPYLTIDEIRGIRYYTLWRMAGNGVQKDKYKDIILPQIEKIICERVNVLNISQLNHKKTPACFEEKTYNKCIELIANNDFWNQEYGLQNGLAGWGMFLLTEIDGDESWFSLLPNDFNKIEK